MKVMLLAHESPGDFNLRDADKERYDVYMGEWYAFTEALRKEGAYLDSSALESPASATVVSVKDGTRSVEDGPYPDMKEQLGGFFIIETPDMETAVKWAQKCPASKNGFVEVRPVMDMGDEE